MYLDRKLFFQELWKQHRCLTSRCGHHSNPNTSLPQSSLYHGRRLQENHSAKETKVCQADGEVQESRMECVTVPNGIGCRDVSAQSEWRTLQLARITGEPWTTAIRRFGEVAEKASYWLWHRREKSRCTCGGLHETTNGWATTTDPRAERCCGQGWKHPETAGYHLMTSVRQYWQTTTQGCHRMQNTTVTNFKVIFRHVPASYIVMFLHLRTMTYKTWCLAAHCGNTALSKETWEIRKTIQRGKHTVLCQSLFVPTALWVD